MTTTGPCEACAVMYINGHRCHETGCPDAWKDSQPECQECGSVFTPDDRYQTCCDADCHAAYHGA